MDAIHAATIFHDWAVTEGLMTDGAAKALSFTQGQLSLIQPSDESAKQILRRRGVLGIIFNDPSREITVLTRLKGPGKKELKALPSKIDDIAVQYRQGLSLTIGGEPSRAHGNPPFFVRQAGGQGHYTCGSSVSQGNCRDAGTMGCLVRDAQGAIYGMSNNHVTGGCSHAATGLPILAPGVLDVIPLGQDPFTIGYHERVLAMRLGTPDNTDPSLNLDAAIFKIAPDVRVTSFQGSYYDTPQKFAPIQPGSNVEKIGRTTAHTHGVIIGQFYGGKAILYDMEIHGFKGRVFFDPIYVVQGIGGTFSQPGDSGALVTTIGSNGERHAVGIVVGGLTDKGSPGGLLTFILPIEPVLQKFGVSLVLGYNV